MKPPLTDQDVAANEAIRVAKNCGLTDFKNHMLKRGFNEDQISEFTFLILERRFNAFRYCFRTDYSAHLMNCLGLVFAECRDVKRRKIKLALEILEG